MEADSITKLITTAREMRSKAQAQYSGYRVGAAVLTGSGSIIGGCNVESASYGLTCCAERIALYNAISSGQNSFTALAVATENGGSPCGACRQVIWEICGNIPVYIVSGDDRMKPTSSAELLPDAFDGSKLPDE